MSVRSGPRWAVAAAVLLLMGARHPMHTAVAEITHLSGAPWADISIRAFSDDFGSLFPALPGSAAADSAMSRYVRGRFAVSNRSGRPAALRWVGVEREGDVIVLHLAVPAPHGLGHARVISALLCERFEDQINIVRAVYDGRSTTLLFTPGDDAKVLP
ncbi:MAG: DUF6702 family protein [Gemmatimonadales bacterium]